MVEAFVRLLCLECGKDREANPTEFPTHRDNYSCQSCGATRRTAKFVRMGRDLQTLKQFE